MDVILEPVDLEHRDRAAEPTSAGAEDPMDLAFDALLPAAVRQHSRVHFTPAVVARRAAALLAPTGTEWVLDVGCGAGKLCAVAAQTVPSAMFVGIERRATLASLATSIARQLALTNVMYLHGDITEIDWARFDAFYLFNPFAEHLPERVSCLDDALDFDPAIFDFYAGHVEEQLDRARIGTRVVTYHGFGGGVPYGYELTVDEEIGTDRLELWIKVDDERGA